MSQVEDLLRQLTRKSASLEKIKAQLGGESSLLPSLQALSSQLVNSNYLSIKQLTTTYIPERKISRDVARSLVIAQP